MDIEQTDPAITGENMKYQNVSLPHTGSGEPAEVLDPPAYVYKSKLTEFFWTLPQPIIALTMMSAVAIAITGGFMSPEALQGDADLLTGFLLFSPLFIILAAERIWTKKKGWLNPSNLQSSLQSSLPSILQ